jgi:hypothetical protein
VEEIDTPGMSSVRRALKEEAITGRVADVIMHAWRPGTRGRYECYHRRWEEFCAKHDFSIRNPAVNHVLDFLMGLFDMGLGYSALNCARSALSMLIVFPGNVPCGQHPRVVSLLKGIFNIRPSLPRHNATWDVNRVLLYFETLEDDGSLKTLSHKAVMLLALYSGHRTQTLQSLKRSNTVIADGRCCFYIDKLLKHRELGSMSNLLNKRRFLTDLICA